MWLFPYPYGFCNPVWIYRRKINDMIWYDIYGKEMCVKLVIYKNYTEMHGQQNIKFCTLYAEIRKLNSVILKSTKFIQLHTILLLYCTYSVISNRVRSCHLIGRKIRVKWLMKMRVLKLVRKKKRWNECHCVRSSQIWSAWPGVVSSASLHQKKFVCRFIIEEYFMAWFLD